MPEALEAFLAYLAAHGRAPSTIENYRDALTSFVRWTNHETPGEISAAEIELGFLPAWEAAFVARYGRKPSPTYRKLLYNALRAFFAFLDRFDLLVDSEGERSRNPMAVIELPALPRRRHDWLRPEQDQALAAAAHTPRERVVYALFRHAGLRVGEAVALVDADVDLARREISVRRSKTPRGSRTVPIARQLVVPIQVWRSHLDRRGYRRPGGAFLATRTGGSMKTCSVREALHRVADRASQQTAITINVTPHTLRRTFATSLLNSGVRLEVVSRLLGHASTTVTEQAYAELLDDRVRAEVANAMGLEAATTPDVPDSAAVRALIEAVRLAIASGDL